MTPHRKILRTSVTGLNLQTNNTLSGGLISAFRECEILLNSVK